MTYAVQAEIDRLSAGIEDARRSLLTEDLSQVSKIALIDRIISNTIKRDRRILAGEIRDAGRDTRYSLSTMDAATVRVIAEQIERSR